MTDNTPALKQPWSRKKKIFVWGGAVIAFLIIISAVAANGKSAPVEAAATQAPVVTAPSETPVAAPEPPAEKTVTVTLSGSSGSTYTWTDATGMHQTTSDGSPVSYTLKPRELINANVIDMDGAATCKAVSSTGEVIVDNTMANQTAASCTKI